MTAAEQLWEVCAEELRARLPDGVWRSCLQSATPLDLDEKTLVLSVPSTVAKDRIESRHLQILEEVCMAGAGRSIQVVLEVQSDAGDFGDGDFDERVRPARAGLRAAGTAGTNPAGAGTAHAGSSAARMGADAARRPMDSCLNPYYTFEAFVTGASNRFAHAAALAVAEKPGNAYNPLFIYGVAGLGKTHLLHAIGNYLGQHYPEMNVRYFSTEAFTNDFIDSIRSNTQMVFKQRYRNADVLLVDDIQFLEKKESTREEFFHTFNALHEENRQIVITSDRSPKSLAALENRLRSRFEWGLVTDVQPPELETRLAILRTKVEKEPISVPPDVLEYIATNVTDNIRELEGALTRVSAFASLNGIPLTLELAQQQLGDLISGEARQLTPQMILDATADMFGLTVADICSKSRSRPLVTARQIGMYVFRQMTDFSYPAIGREFGGRDHTTVMHAVDKVSTLMKQRRQIYDQVMALMHRLGAGG